jgi:predicted nuclease with TOPRIM domain
VDLSWHAVSLVFTTVIGLYTWISAGQRVHRDQLDRHRAELEERGDQLLERVAKLEKSNGELTERVAHLPSKEQVHELALATIELRATMIGVGQQYNHLNLRLDRIDDFLAKVPR